MRAVVQGLGTEAIVTACVVGRLAATWACTTGIPAARPDGLGATVAGTVSRKVAALRHCPGAGARRRLRRLAGRRRRTAPGPARRRGGVALGLTLAGLLVARCVRRFGGVTGDVLGAAVEIATLGALLALAR